MLRISRKMFLGLILCCYCVSVNGILRPVEMSVYTPPTYEEILDKYFHDRDKETQIFGRNKKSIANNSDKFYKEIEFMKNDLSTNITNLRREMFAKNLTEIESKSNVSSVVGNIIQNGVLKPFLPKPVETTTYQYPTATWKAEAYERFKRKRGSKRFQQKPSPFLKPPRVLPKIKPRPKEDSLSSNSNQIDKNFYDRFLEQSLNKYLFSSNLKENIGNVSVRTFTEILKNVTQQKTNRTKKLSSPYDENKELRMRFRDGVFAKKRNENRTQGGILEKQFQRRLEKMQDVNNEKKINQTETKTQNVEAPDAVEAIKEVQEEISENTTALPKTTTDITLEAATVLTEKPVTKSATRNKSSRGELKLSVAETVYYRKRQYPVKSYFVPEEIPGVIPGVPEVDYPMYSSPPATGFRCPKPRGERPSMMADVKTRCQVFYICSNDGPAAPMLCPNGTMFNENVLVCDWWYNVDC